MPEPSTFQDVINQDPQAWEQETPEVKQQVAKAFFQKHFESTPDFQGETPEVKSQISSAFTKKYNVSFDGGQPLKASVSGGPGVVAGLGNVLGAVGKGLGNAAKAAINPQTYTGLAGEVGNALQTEIQSNDARSNLAPADPQTALNNALPNIANRLTGQLPVNGQAPAPDALDLIQAGGRQVINGITGIPADVANAYQGKPAFHNDWEIPESPREAAIRKKYPVSSFIGDQLPYAIPIAGEGNLLRTAAEGAGIGALQNGGDGLAGRVANAAAGAAIPTALKTAGKALKGRLQFEAAPSLPSQAPVDIVHPENIQSQIPGTTAQTARTVTASQAPIALEGRTSSQGTGISEFQEPNQLQGQQQRTASPSGEADLQTSPAPLRQNRDALQNLHTSVDDFNAQPTKNYQSLARKTRDLAQHVSEDEFESAMGKLSREDLNAVGRLLGC